jgi:2-hydroxychromene-2-carboxylate isomerase
MGRKLEFFFDVGSPTAYLAYTQLPFLATACDAQLVMQPMLLGGVFKATGNASPVTVPAKGVWMHADLARWAARYQVAYQHNSYFPINTLALMRIITAIQLNQPEKLFDVLDVIFKAMWANNQNMADPAIVKRVFSENGLNADGLFAQSTHDTVKARLMSVTEQAVQRGVFGAPSMFVNGELFFGQDRLEFVREALLAQP